MQSLSLALNVTLAMIHFNRGLLSPQTVMLIPRSLHHPSTAWAKGCSQHCLPNDEDNQMELHNPQQIYSVQVPRIPRANFSPKRFRKALSNVHLLISRKLRLTRNAVSPTALRRFHHPPLAYFSLLKAIISIM